MADRRTLPRGGSQTPGDPCDLFLSRRAPRWRIEAGFGYTKLIRKLGDVLEDNLSAL
ncbi:hypothetical protein G6321_00026650 [Bradyrhizobium barranii subsp. barranii]|uniref:Uncharacterized protein n=1 Tax=Bradyrhizobium barranii subsp. barranii TaxID=2823807 RepID=A0A7Z0QJR5_9BRAD|nr:hypothetical protein [Bradyrhizobium barranii]UGX98505.1 hypothetical protein G6321_00026650 [Bradyrhizobium barranii subsp. barranii]